MLRRELFDLGYLSYEVERYPGSRRAPLLTPLTAASPAWSNKSAWSIEQVFVI